MEKGNFESFVSELSSSDGELLRYPQRAFEFENAGSVLVDQSTDSVATIVWDSEVFLAHYLDSLTSDRLSKKCLLELGAGTSLGSIVALRLGGVVVVQELEEVVAESRKRVEQNEGAARFVSGRWGSELASKILEESELRSFDWIVMSDVLYQPEHFSDLNSVLVGCSKLGTQVVVAHEARRLDLSPYFSSLSEVFECERVVWYEVCKQSNEDFENEKIQTTSFFLHHLRRVVD